MGNRISKLMEVLHKDNSDHGMKCFSTKSNDSYVSCTKRNSITKFRQKHSKSFEDEVLKTFNEIAQSGN